MEGLLCQQVVLVPAPRRSLNVTSAHVELPHTGYKCVFTIATTPTNGILFFSRREDNGMLGMYTESSLNHVPPTT
jgi:hypothetical protein